MVKHKHEAKHEATHEAVQSRRERDIAAHKAAVEAQQTEEVEFHDEGYDETLPGQTPVVAGSAAHQRVLSSFPNATSYGPDVNVVVAPEVVAGAPTVVDVPYVSQSGNTLNCTMGNWTGEPTEYHYGWTIDGIEVGDDSPQYAVVEMDVGHTATCVVSAVNAVGETTAPPSNSHVVT